MPREPFVQARILVVDDEVVNTLLLERMLRRAGYTQVTVTQPRTAARSSRWSGNWSRTSSCST
jgi:CheY-like chemotaxis protein